MSASVKSFSLLSFKFGGSSTSTATTFYNSLPYNVMPKHYDVLLNVYVNRFKMEGEVTTTLIVRDDHTSAIQLNAHPKIMILSTELRTSSTGIMRPNNTYHDENNETITFNFEKFIPQEIVNLYIKYKTSFKSHEMVQLMLPCFEITADKNAVVPTVVDGSTARVDDIRKRLPARRLLPCWDEPSFPARFRLTLITDKRYDLILSNTKALKRSVVPGDDKEMFEDEYAVATTFTQTPFMSADNLMFLIGESKDVQTLTSKCITAVNHTNTSTFDVNVYVPIIHAAVGKPNNCERALKSNTEAVKFGQLALESAVHCLTQFQTYFNVNYVLSKLDVLLTYDGPSDSKWGVLTIDRNLMTPNNRGRLVETLCRQVSRQWFNCSATVPQRIRQLGTGNLWLNDGIVTFLGSFFASQVRSHTDEYKIRLNNENRFRNVLVMDSLGHRSFAVNPASMSDITSKLNVNEMQAVNLKSAAIVDMVRKWMGDESFCSAIKTYLTYGLYNLLKKPEVYKLLEAGSGKDGLGDMLETWITNDGYPVLFVTAKTGSNKDKLITVQQRRFVYQDLKSAKWHVPVAVMKLGNGGKTKVVKKFVLTGKLSTIRFENMAANEYVFVRKHGAYYRVAYSPQMLSDLIPYGLRFMPNEEITDFLDDLYQLTRGGYSEWYTWSFGLTSSVFDLMTTLFRMVMSPAGDRLTKQHWIIVVKLFDWLTQLFSNTDFFPIYCQHAATILTNVYRHVGWEKKLGEPLSFVTLRPFVIRYLGLFGDSKVVAEATRRFDAISKGTLDCEPELVEVIYQVAMMEEQSLKNVKNLYHKLRGQLRNEETPPQRLQLRKLIRALGLPKNDDLLMEILMFAFSNEVDPKHRHLIFAAISNSNPFGRELFWEFFCTNFRKLKRMYLGGNSRSVAEDADDEADRLFVTVDEADPEYTDQLDGTAKGWLTRGDVFAGIVWKCLEFFATSDMAAEVEEFFKLHPVPVLSKTIKDSVLIIRTNWEVLKKEKEKARSFFRNRFTRKVLGWLGLLTQFLRLI